MLNQVQATTFQVEVILPDYLLRANLTPLGQMATYLNDRARGNVRFTDLELSPFATDRQVKVINQPLVTVDKHTIELVSVTNPEQATEIQVLQSKRSAVFYTAHFAIQGYIHVNADARDDDLLDETRDFFPMSEVSVFPLRATAVTPTRRVPMAMLSRLQVQLYHVLAAPG